jgi:trypsin
MPCGRKVRAAADEAHRPRSHFPYDSSIAGLSHPRAICALLLLVFASAATFASPAAPAAEPLARASIVSGTPATPAQFPYLAVLKQDGDTICGGSLIAPDRVLTAAHCIDTMVVGDIVTVGPTAVRRVKHFAQDPRLTEQVLAGRSRDSVLPYDAAVLLLDAPVTDVAPIRLAQVADAALYASGAPLVTVGYGSIDREGNGVDVLRYADVQARSDAECTSLLTPLGAGPTFVGPTMICTTDPDNAPPYRSACYGDSGSPLVATAPDGTLVQVGIDDWGVACGFRNGDPENYVEVPPVAAFALSPTPVLRPEARTRPKLTGRPVVGRTLRCSKPRFRGRQPDRVRRAFFVLSGRTSRIVASGSASYRIPRKMRGRRLSCLVMAHSAGGEIVVTAATSKRAR